VQGTDDPFKPPRQIEGGTPPLAAGHEEAPARRLSAVQGADLRAPRVSLVRIVPAAAEEEERREEIRNHSRSRRTFHTVPRCPAPFPFMIYRKTVQSKRFRLPASIEHRQSSRQKWYGVLGFVAKFPALRGNLEI
jgi:hypothetical protein